MIRFGTVHGTLATAYGTDEWWPAEDAFEIMVGAVLVQRTTWQNAAQAVEQLKGRGLLKADVLDQAEPESIEACIRCAGFFRMKAGRLQSLAQAVVAAGGVSGLRTMSTLELRHWLLGLNGVGEETADVMLLYAFGRPAIVVDAYLRRLSGRLVASAEVPTDDQLRLWIGNELDDAGKLNELHALVIEHGKRTCRPVPRCGECVLAAMCRTRQEALDA